MEFLTELLQVILVLVLVPMAGWIILKGLKVRHTHSRWSGISIIFGMLLIVALLVFSNQKIKAENPYYVEACIAGGGLPVLNFCIGEVDF